MFECLVPDVGIGTMQGRTRLTASLAPKSSLGDLITQARFALRRPPPPRAIASLVQGFRKSASPVCIAVCQNILLFTRRTSSAFGMVLHIIVIDLPSSCVFVSCAQPSCWKDVVVDVR